MTSQQVNELRVVLQLIGVTQAMFREAVSRFERLAATAGHAVSIVSTDDFTGYELGVSREDLDYILKQYKGKQ
jgi:hypothetical protein